MKGWEKGAVRLGKRVRELRLARGLSQERLGEACELHRTYVADIERGHRNPSLWTLERLAAGLGCEVRDLFPQAAGASKR
jgi:transcriptional regulator with XRE-family HTH domain